MAYKATDDTGLVEIFQTRKELDWAVEISDEQYRQIELGATTVDSFLGPVTITRIRRCTCT